MFLVLIVASTKKLFMCTLGIGTNCSKIHLNFFSFYPYFFPAFPKDLRIFPQIIVASELSIKQMCFFKMNKDVGMLLLKKELIQVE